MFKPKGPKVLAGVVWSPRRQRRARATPWAYFGPRALTLISRATGPLRPWRCCSGKGPGCAAATLRSGASNGGP
eukprot:7624848-Alexandrium_andersonii.AAC.1